ADDSLLDDDLGVFERLLDVAAVLVKVEGDVVGPLRVDCGGAGGDRLLRIGDGGQNVVLHFDKIGRVACDVAVGSNDNGHGVASVVHAVLREEVMVRDAKSGQRSGAGDRAEVCNIGAGEDRY